MSFPKVFRRMIEQNVLEVLYISLLSLVMIIDVDVLKWDGQYPRLMHELAILTKFMIY